MKVRTAILVTLLISLLLGSVALANETRPAASGYHLTTLNWQANATLGGGNYQLQGAISALGPPTCCCMQMFLPCVQKH